MDLHGPALQPVSGGLLMRGARRQPGSVTLALTFHREGDLAGRGIRAGLGVVRDAISRGLDCRLVAVVDSPDDLTWLVIAQLAAVNAELDILPVACADVGMARNAIIEVCDTDWLVLCDGDDLLSRSFLADAVQAAGAADRVILHPELVVYFGARRALVRQSPSASPAFDAAGLLIANPWTSCAMAPTRIFREVRYAPLGQARAFGYEDWHWNCETIARGIAHVVIPGTAHYVRRKLSSSLNRLHDDSGAVFPAARLFDRLPIG